MASVTLAESAKLCQNELVAGVIENVVTVNRMFELLPFDDIEGNALQYNRENALGAAGVTGVGTAISSGASNPIDSSTGAKAAATFTSITTGLTTILGDAEVNGLIQATRSNPNDQRAVQVASKAKHVGRIYQHMFINGTGSGNQLSGLALLCATGQKVDTGVDGAPLSFVILDELLDKITDKDGSPDWIMMHARTLRSYMALLRNLGGASINEVVSLPSGAKVPAYRGVPIFRNDYIPIDGDQGASVGITTTVFAGTFDDGSRTHGVAGLTARDMAGIQVIEVGEKEDYDESITRVKWYCGLALFSELGLSCAEGITN